MFKNERKEDEETIGVPQLAEKSFFPGWFGFLSTWQNTFQDSHSGIDILLRDKNKEVKDFSFKMDWNKRIRSATLR